MSLFLTTKDFFAPLEPFIVEYGFDPESGYFTVYKIHPGFRIDDDQIKHHLKTRLIADAQINWSRGHIDGSMCSVKVIWNSAADMHRTDRF